MAADGRTLFQSANVFRPSGSRRFARLRGLILDLRGNGGGAPAEASLGLGW